jgi:hypothetical protein
MLSTTRLLKKKVNIAFKTNNTLEKHLTKARRKNTDTDAYDNI